MNLPLAGVPAGSGLEIGVGVQGRSRTSRST